MCSPIFLFCTTLSMKLVGRHVSVQKQKDTVCPKLYN